MDQKHIGLFLGSFRKESYSRKIANTVTAFFPKDTYKVTVLPLDELPLFNQDYEAPGQTPESWLAYRQIGKELDGFLMVTPEYNRSVTPVLKNAIDIGSRPPRENFWDRLPGAIIGVSPGSLGGFGGQQHLRQSLASLGAYVMPNPETYIGGVIKLLDQEGHVQDPKTLAFLETVAKATLAWIDRFPKK